MCAFQRVRLWELQQLSNIPYDKSNEEHEKILLQLWKGIFPDTPLESRVSRQWKMMGFQVPAVCVGGSCMWV